MLVPLNIKEIKANGGLLETDDLYNDEKGLIWSGNNYDILYYGGDQYTGGKPFTGILYMLYPNGNLKHYETFKFGVYYGDYYKFYMNGNIKKYMEYKAGSLTGKVLTFFENGSKKSDEVYKMGFCISKIVWDIDGNIIENMEKPEKWIQDFVNR